MRWDLGLTATDMAIASNPLSEIADLTGDIILDGLLDDGIDSKLCHQIVNAFREQRNQTLYLVGDRFDSFSYKSHPDRTRRKDARGSQPK